MKNGIFLVFLAVITLVLPSCATFFDLGEEEVSTFDRGYSLNTSEEDDDSNCTGRFCDKPEQLAPTKELSFDERRVLRAIEARDVILGMTRQQVSESWGEPTVREAAGSGEGGHERWTYGSKFSLSGSRVVIFENGKVAGWNR